MEHPSGLPEHLQPPLDAAIHKAEVEFLERKKKAGETYLERYWQGAILLYMKTVFFAYAEQARLAGAEGVWTGEEIRKNITAYLRHVALEVYREKYPPELMSGPRPMASFAKGIVEAIQAQPEWIDLQKKLIDVAKHRQSSPGDNTDAEMGDPEPGNASAAGPTAYRESLLAEYKALTGASNKQIYEAQNSGIHKPEFYNWLHGRLSSKSATSINFERFLRAKKKPVPRTPKG